MARPKRSSPAAYKNKKPKPAKAPKEKTKKAPERSLAEWEAILDAMTTISYTVDIKATSDMVLPPLAGQSEEIVIPGEPAKTLTLNAYDDQELIATLRAVYGLDNVKKVVAADGREVPIPRNEDDDGWDQSDDEWDDITSTENNNDHQ